MTKGLIPVTLLKKFRGGNGGEVFGYKPQLASKMVAAGIASWLDKRSEDMARSAGVTVSFQRAALIDMEAEARAEAKAADIVAEKDARIKELQAAIVQLQEANDGMKKKTDGKNSVPKRG